MMKKLRNSLVWRSVLVFMAVLCLRVAWCRLVPSDDTEGSNLLVNLVFAAIVTAPYALVDWLWLNRLFK